MLEIYFLDLIGTFAFAVYGSYIALGKKLDIFGVSVCALITAVGGGTIRDLILNRAPFYFFDFYYLIIIVLGIIFSIITYLSFHKINKYMLFLDAIGICTFALVGAQKAAEAGFGGVGIIFLATITAVGGGILRDIAINKMPDIFYRELYATPAIILGTLYYLFIAFASNRYFIYSLLIIAFSIRVYGIYHRLNLWAPWRNIKRFT